MSGAGPYDQSHISSLEDQVSRYGVTLLRLRPIRLAIGEHPDVSAIEIEALGDLVRDQLRGRKSRFRRFKADAEARQAEEFAALEADRIRHLIGEDEGVVADDDEIVVVAPSAKLRKGVSMDPLKSTSEERAAEQRRRSVKRLATIAAKKAAQGRSA